MPEVPEYEFNKFIQYNMPNRGKGGRIMKHSRLNRAEKIKWYLSNKS